MCLCVLDKVPKEVIKNVRLTVTHRMDVFFFSLQLGPTAESKSLHQINKDGNAVCYLTPRLIISYSSCSQSFFKFCGDMTHNEKMLAVCFTIRRHMSECHVICILLTK